MGHTRRFVLAGAAALMLSSTAAAFAQTNRITGVVRDETGDRIRGGIVRAETGPTASPFTLTTATDPRGRFVVMVARSGEWRLTFEAPGFKPMTIPLEIRLTGAAPNIEVKLIRDEAPEAFGALAGLDSEVLMAQLAEAATQLDEGHYDEAIAAYQLIKARAPVLTLVNLQIGNAYLAKGSYAEAEAAFQELLNADPADPNGFFAMGTLREAQGSTAEAQSWYQKAAAADAGWTRPLLKLAALAGAAGDGPAAAQYLARVIEIAPESGDAATAADMQKQLR